MMAKAFMKHTRRTFLRLAPAGFALGADAPPPATTVWYKQPAGKWEEALAVGNGRLGAMIFGGVAKERLQLNEITVWSGRLEHAADRVDAHRKLPEIRSLLDAGKYADAAKAMTANMTCATGGRFGRDSYGSYQTLGDLDLTFPEPRQVGGYMRWLDIGEATAGVRYEADGKTWTREVFSSAVDQVLVMRIACSTRNAVNFDLGLTRVKWAETRSTAPNTLTMTGSSLGQTGDLRYEAQVRVMSTGGGVSSVGGRIRVTDADEAIILLAAGTDYALDYTNEYKGPDPHAAVATSLDKASRRRYSAMRVAHVRDYQGYFHRVSLDIGRGANADLPTDERLRRFSAGEDDPALISLFYQFGRYLLISSSRPDNPLPSNSQGIWGDGLSLPWGCDYKSNINFQMNYWPAETANLGECHLPMVRMIEAMVEPGKKTAKAYFDAPGWAMAYTTNAWGWTAPGPAGPWGPFFCGGAWTCQHLWEHYVFTRDRAYLRRVYGVMKGAAEACLHMLIPDANGKLITSPSTSPENRFRTDDGQASWVCEGAAADRQIIWELFNNTAMAARSLAIDDEFCRTMEEAQAKIRPPEIGRGGQIMEWGKDWDLNAPEPRHRHFSHLFALHPGRQISPDATPELASAAKVTLNTRGDASTGWSQAWKINCWARLHDGDRALKLIREQLKLVDTTQTNYQRGGGTYMNLFDAHPPFQIDGNFGALSGITEMLLQSHLMFQSGGPPADRYILHILPALPSAWRNGQVRGLRGRGGIEADLIWKDGKAVEAKLKPLASGVWRIRPPQGQRIESVVAGSRTVAAKVQPDGTSQVEMARGEIYGVRFAQ